MATITPEKEQLLKDLFWEMNEITHRTETKTETIILETDDGNGNILEEEVQETITTLYITVSHKTADEMAAQYGFNEDQKQQLAELLAQDSSMWAAVLYGIYGVDDQIVAVALSQVGNVGGEPYWSWYGFGSPCGVVRLLRQLVCERMRLYRHRRYSEVRRLCQRCPMVPGAWAVGG